MRKTKILCTLGPASNDLEMIGKLLDAGMNAARVNFSHGDHEEHARRIVHVREAGRQRDRKIPIVADLQGPKIRTGKLAGGTAVELKEGEMLRLTPEPILGDREVISIDYDSLAQDVEPGDSVLLADGSIALRVEKLQGDDVVCTVLNSGILGQRKGVNIPGADLRLPSITEKDKEDLKFAIEQDVEYIALSFVRKAKDVRLAKNAIEWAGKDTHVIAKLEKPQAIEQLDEIMEVADGVMIARGDLGVELSPWKVPIVQKQVIEQAARMRKPVVTATQMLESMIYNPTPTRAEASDVANAVFDGSDALMLSGETAIGRYPAESVAMMARIIEAAEAHSAEARLSLPPLPGADGDLSAEVARSAARLAQELDAKYIVVYTESGYTARLVSKHRPKASILGLSRHAAVCQRMKLLWGVRAREIGQVKDLDHLVAETERMMLQLGWVGPGDLICLVAGTPFQVAGKTDLIKLHRIGEFVH